MQQIHTKTHNLHHQRFTVTRHQITNDCGVTVIFHKQHSYVSNQTTTTQVDTESNNDCNTQSVENPRKHKNRIPERLETTSTTTSVQATVNYLLCQMSSST